MADSIETKTTYRATVICDLCGATITGAESFNRDLARLQATNKALDAGWDYDYESPESMKLMLICARCAGKG